MSAIKIMKCQFCAREATGLNYRPSPGISDAFTCQMHTTSLYLPFARQDRNPSPKHDDFFNELLNTFVGQYNLFKSELLSSQALIDNLTPENASKLSLPCSITNPQMIIRDDKQMMVNSLLQSVKRKYQANQRRNRQGSPFEIRGASMKKSQYVDSVIEKAPSKGQTSSMKTSLITEVSRQADPRASQQLPFPTFDLTARQDTLEGVKKRF